MIRILLQNGFNYWYNKENIKIEKIPIPNGLNEKDIIFNRHKADICAENKSCFSIFDTLEQNIIPLLRCGLCFYTVNEFNLKFVTLESYGNDNLITYFPLEIILPRLSLVTKNIFSSISPTILRMLQDINCNLRLLLWFPSEGHSHAYWDLNHLLKANLAQTNIPAEKIYFIYGDQRSQTNWQDTGKLDLDIKVIPLNVFETIYVRHMELYLPNKKNCITNFNNKKNFYYVFKNGRHRGHRIYLLLRLMYEKLTDYGIYSFLNADKNKKKEDLLISLNKFKYANNITDNKIDNLYNFNDFYSKIPIKIKGEENRNHHEDMYVEVDSIYNNTYFSIVSETTAEDNVLFITEKTYQPIYNFHPFIIAGGWGTLDYLRKCGYKTFPDLFDESYDKEKNNVARMEKIIDNIKNVVSGNKDDYLKSDELKSILIHNHNNLMQRVGQDYKRLYKNLMQQN